jgi:hypothetical protein
MNRKMIGEAIYIRVSEREKNLIAMKRGNKKPSDGRGISD